MWVFRGGFSIIFKIFFNMELFSIQPKNRYAKASVFTKSESLFGTKIPFDVERSLQTETPAGIPFPNKKSIPEQAFPSRIRDPVSKQAFTLKQEIFHRLLHASSPVAQIFKRRACPHPSHGGASVHFSNAANKITERCRKRR